jgi:hypothetical protein
VTIKIDVDDRSAAELDACAATIGFRDFNECLEAYVKAELLAARAAKIVVPEPDISDAVIGASSVADLIG